MPYKKEKIDDEDIDFLLKIVIIGDSGVGKTNLLSRFTRNVFDDDTRNTIGVDFSATELKLRNQNIKTQFWDTAGQEKYRAIASAYYKNAHGAIVVYDITRRDSFENVNVWLDELKEHGDTGINIIILGNKIDLVTQREVTVEEGQKLAESKRAFFMEVSGKTNAQDCVNTAFLTIIDNIVKQMEKRHEEMNGNELSSIRANSINIAYGNEANRKKRCC